VLDSPGKFAAWRGGTSSRTASPTDTINHSDWRYPLGLISISVDSESARRGCLSRRRSSRATPRDPLRNCVLMGALRRPIPGGARIKRSAANSHREAWKRTPRNAAPSAGVYKRLAPFHRRRYLQGSRESAEAGCDITPDPFSWTRRGSPLGRRSFAIVEVDLDLKARVRRARSVPTRVWAPIRVNCEA
jgi:hypothetical protein